MSMGRVSYTALISTAPDLLSFIDRKALLTGTVAKSKADMTALDNEYEREVAALNAKLSALKMKFSHHVLS